MAKRCRGAKQVAVDRAERRGERLYGEWETVYQRSDHQPFESEGQSVAGERLPPAAKRAPRTKCYEDIKAEHSRRQDDGKRNRGLDQKSPTPARVSKPLGDGHSNRVQP